ncbi:uncharacterized protein PF3D7_1120000-like [Clytia hemisphaerica]|uniref:Uncharacterized protein n=1 Tax=Clytia hemisphaerica TaxID=252671 RepID=A0A7M5V7M0_9CNID
MDQHNAAGIREDENHRVVVGEEKSQQNLKEELESLKKDREIEKLKFEAVIEKLKLQNEKLENKVEIGNLKSENTLLKAEKQFGIDLKTISDGKQKVEEELRNIKEENTILKEAKSNLQKELDVLEEKNKSLLTEKTDFQELYETCKHEKEEANKQIKVLEDQVEGLKETNQRLRDIKGFQKNFADLSLTKRTPKVEKYDFKRMPYGESVLAGVHMIFEKTKCKHYDSWYKNLYQRVCTNAGFFKDILFLTNSEHSDTLHIKIDKREQRWEAENLKCVKLLHSSDNTKCKDLEYLGGKEWFVSGLTNFHISNYYITFVMKDSGE